MKNFQLLYLTFVLLLVSFTAQGQCSNIDFELTSTGTYTGASTYTSVSSWTISSQSTSMKTCSTVLTYTAGSPEFSIVQTPYNHPVNGWISASPLGGSNVAHLNNMTGNSVSTRLTRTYQITNTNPVLLFAWAAILEDGNHTCCEASQFSVKAYNCQGQLIACTSQSFSGAACSGTSAQFTVSSGYYRSNWQTNSIDLSAYTGSCVTIEVIADDCSYGGHYGELFFDAICSTAQTCNCYASDNATRVNFCAGTSQAIIQAPLGQQSYSWVAPSGYPALPASQATLSALTVTNPVPGNIFTVTMTSTAGCISAKAYTLVYTSVAAGTSSVSASCSPGSTGSATLYPTGSGVGYNYSWVSSATNSVVSTASVAANIPSGTYIVSVTATAGCGSVAATVIVPAFTSTFDFSTPGYSVCSGNSVMAMVVHPSSPSPGQYTYSWSPNIFLSAANAQFAQITPTAAPGTVNNLVYTVVVTPTAMNCPVTKTLVVNAANPLTPVIQPIPKLCVNSASYQVQATPAGGYFSAGAVNPVNGVLTPSLAAAGIHTFTYTAALGSCAKSSASSYTILNTPTLSVSGNNTICAKQTATLVATGATAYSWWDMSVSPTKTVSPLVQTAYKVIGYDTLTGCSDTALISVHVNPVPLIVVSGPDSACVNDVIPVQASGAQLYSWSHSTVAGAVASITLAAGTKNYSVSGSYTTTGCVSSNIFTRTGFSRPVISLTGNPIFCKNDPLLLTVSGGQRYLWSDGSTNPMLSYPIGQPGTFTLTAFNGATCSNSIVVNAVEEECTGIAQYAETSDILIYPNPVKTALYLECPDNVRVRVYNSTGMLIAENVFPAGKNTLDTHSWISGIYFVRSFYKGGHAVMKVIKVN